MFYLHFDYVIEAFARHGIGAGFRVGRNYQLTRSRLCSVASNLGIQQNTIRRRHLQIQVIQNVELEPLIKVHVQAPKRLVAPCIIVDSLCP